MKLLILKYSMECPLDIPEQHANVLRVTSADLVQFLHHALASASKGFLKGPILSLILHANVK